MFFLLNLKLNFMYKREKNGGKRTEKEISKSHDQNSFDMKPFNKKWLIARFK